MAHCFKVMVNGMVQEFTKYEDIPAVFEHVIEFVPDIPQPPYTEAEQLEIQEWLPKFNRLMEIEHASSSKER